MHAVFDFHFIARAICVAGYLAEASPNKRLHRRDPRRTPEPDQSRSPAVPAAVQELVLLADRRRRLVQVFKVMIDVNITFL
jgi:hypothetical protein